MKRALLTLAAAVLGTGCVVNDNPCGTDVALTWSFTDETGAPASCADLGMNYVDVWDGGSYLTSYSCVGSGGTAALPTLSVGSHTLVVEGVHVDTSGTITTIITRDFVDASSSTCTSFGVSATPGRGVLRMNYTLTPTNACVPSDPGSATGIWYTVDDLTSGAPLDSIGPGSSLADRGAVLCSTTNEYADVFAPYGGYSVSAMAEVSNPTTPSYATESRLCAPVEVDVGTWGTTNSPVLSLLDVGFACP
ncbi:MAG TPA: hypothetical protein VLU43_06585 [Anaeromyxobacteraceae bacterium]|nr:hypothetical protein [Anaeromyxobacteraceae bacterium]